MTAIECNVAENKKGGISKLENIRISLCMIVKNEEDCIARCLQSVQDIVDEIIIVDTGSTDRTIEICKSFQTKIESFDWNESFADARNYGIEKATGDWILWLDADEELEENVKGKFRTEIDSQKYDALTLLLVNYYGKQVNKSQTTDVAHLRLFKRNVGIKFINKIHEVPDLGDIDPSRIGHLDVKVYHYGYLDSVIEDKDKYNRNIKMLEHQIEEGENVYWAHYYIAMEHYRKKQLQEAFNQVNLSIQSFLENLHLPPSMVYKLKYSILIAMGSFDGAWPAIEKAIALYPDYVDLHYFKGVILYNLNRYEEALDAFEYCLKLGEDNFHYLILKGVGSFQTWYFKGLCYQKLQKNEEAVAAFLHSLLISPEFEEVWDSIKTVHQEHPSLIGEMIKKYFNPEEVMSLQRILDKFI